MLHRNRVSRPWGRGGFHDSLRWYKIEEQERFSALVRLGVELNGRTRTDYEKIVAEAARRLARDFSHMATDLAETHG